MPRPGPRPYECVRRAWHSDRHQPIRGSIIQQIFRVVHERHGVKSKKNREWQEKLPVVVLKAEEIMYSKANSEAEYVDLDTLWDRLNDAIDTIIRRDESAETGQFLPPCVEAALNLGCVPVRASRSQRHNTPRSYLSPRTEETGIPPNVLRTERNPTMGDVHPSSRLVSGTTINVKSANLASEISSGLMPQIGNRPNLSSTNTPSAYNNIFPMDTNMSNVGSVYPLYYDNRDSQGPVDLAQPKVRQLKSQELHNSKTIILGVPVFPSTAEPADVGMPSIFHCKNRSMAHKPCCQENFRDKRLVEPEMECDLSLRLGSSFGSSLGMAADSTGDTPDATPSNYQREFSFFPVKASNDPCLAQTRRRDLESGGQFPESVIGKRKASLVNMDWPFSWKEEPTSKHFSGQMRGPDGTGNPTAERNTNSE
ncbi:hypothetical protein Leryth_025686 [Lithospermum erythrorhizon]|nr:hypothetical protein Leryth_025686 [Lithospermum erythrorhizon]